MGQTLTIRLPKELSDWVEKAAARLGVSRGQLIRDQLEKAKAASTDGPFMRLAGSVRGPKDLSKRRGFSSP